jgi:hypothetical protein
MSTATSPNPRSAAPSEAPRTLAEHTERATNTGRPNGSIPRRSALTGRLNWMWLFLVAVGVTVFALAPYTTGSLSQLARENTTLAANYATQPGFVQAAFYAHVVFGGTALLIGSLQFAAGFRRRFPAAHRVIGRVYLISVALAALASLVMTPFSQAGFIGWVGFTSLNAMWLFTAGRAIRSIRSRDVRAHQSWMIRNYALTYAAVTLRLILGVGIALQLTLSGGAVSAADAFANVYIAVPILAWLPNIVIAELIVHRRRLPGLRWVASAA